MMIYSRYFNVLELNKNNKIIRKSSYDKKLHNEINWYLKIPNDIKKYIPVIYDYNLNSNNKFIDLKYYSHKTLSDYFLSDLTSELIWNKVFAKLKALLSDFYFYKVDANACELSESLNLMYFNKTMDRLREFQLQNIIEYNKPLYINETKYMCVNDYINILFSLLSEKKIFECDCFNLIHGDLCFSNILYDELNNRLIVIDPRGSFGNFSIYGDQRYDLSKIYHSFNGLYDCIKNDSFILDKNKNSISLKIKKPKHCDAISILFKNLLHEFKIDIIQIQLINILLYLSMLPLHKDNIKHQLAFLSIGIMNLDELINLK